MTTLPTLARTDALALSTDLAQAGAVFKSLLVSPIVGFIFDQKGLMYNLTLEGSKITRIAR